MNLKFTDGMNVAGALLRIAEMAEGEYPAVIKEAKIVNGCKTKFGYADAIDIVYTVDYGVCDIEKKERIFITNYVPSKCQTLIRDLYGDNVPEEIAMHQQVGRKCILVIKHNTDSIGNVYDNIVERKFI